MGQRRGCSLERVILSQHPNRVREKNVQGQGSTVRSSGDMSGGLVSGRETGQEETQGPGRTGSPEAL